MGWNTDQILRDAAKIRQAAARKKVKPARRTRTEISASAPTTPRGEREKAAALAALDAGDRPSKVYSNKTGRKAARPTKAQRRTLARAIKTPYEGPSASGLTKAERALADFQNQRNDFDSDKSFTSFVDKDGSIRDFEEFAPTGIRIVRALVGDKPGASEPTLGELGNIALTLGTGGAGAAVRGATKVATAAKVAKASQAAKAPRAAEAARVAKKTKAASKPRRAATKAKSRAKQRYTKPERKVRRAKRLERTALRSVNPVAPAVAQSESVRGAIEGHAKALKEDPVKVLKTTYRTALGVPAAATADAVDLVTGNFGDFAKSQEDYLATFAKLFEGDSEKAKQTILDDVGLVPALTAGLGVRAGVNAKRSVAPKTPKPSKVSRKRKRDLKAAESPDANTRFEARRRLAEGDYKEPRGQVRRNRRRESERSASTAEIEEGLAAVESRETGKRRGKVGPRRTLEADVAKLAKAKVGKSHVTEADVIRLAGELGLSGKEPNLIAILRRERQSLKESRRKIDPDSKNTRAVLDALIAEPKAVNRVQDVLDRWDRIQAEQAIERARELDPDAVAPTLADEHVRLSGVMRNERIPAGSERIPVSLRGITKIKEGPKADQRIRQSSKQAQKRARKLREVADELGDTPKAQSLRNRAAVNETRAVRQLEIVDRFRQAKSLDSRAARLEKNGDRLEAEGLRAEAERQRALGDEEQALRAQEAVNAASARVKETGRREPIYAKQDDVTDSAANPNSGVPFSRKAAKEKFRSGGLAKRGMVDESAINLLTNLRAQRAALAERGRQRGFVDESFLAINGNRLGTRDEWAAHAEAGRIPDGYELVPIGEIAPATQRTPTLRKEVERKRIDVQATTKGTVYAMVPGSALKEFRAQATPAAGLAKGLRTVGRAQGILMLATSPAWFAFQLVATPLVMAARNPNPLAWVRATRSAIDTWRHTDRRTRVTFNGMFGGNPSDFLTVGDNVRAVSPYRLKDMRGALELAFKSPAGRIARAITDNVKQGGPLIKTNRRMEAALRVLTAHMEMDRLAGLNGKGNPRLTAKPLEFITSTADGVNAIYSHMRQLEGKTPAQRVEWYTKNPKEMARLEHAVNEATGNWSAMTARERALSGVVVFYPFIRFSLRWLHYEFPKNNPVKAAIALNLSQSNAQGLEELLGGSPGFFTGWGQIVTHVGEGEQITDLARAAPGGNALVESVAGADELNLSTLSRPLQPAISTFLNALDNKDQFGNAKDASTGALLAGGGVSLNPLTRGFRDKVLPPSEISQLFRVIDGRDGSLDESLIPDPFVDMEAERETVKLSHLLDTAYGYESDEKQDYALGTPERKDMNVRKKASEAAWKEINAMLVAYGVKAEGDEKREGEQYNRRQYGAPASESTESSGAFDSVFGGGSQSTAVKGGAFEQVFK